MASVARSRAGKPIIRLSLVLSLRSVSHQRRAQLARVDSLHAHDLLACACPPHDRHPPNTHTRPLGDQPAERVVGAPVHRGSAHPHEKTPSRSPTISLARARGCRRTAISQPPRRVATAGPIRTMALGALARSLAPGLVAIGFTKLAPAIDKQHRHDDHDHDDHDPARRCSGACGGRVWLPLSVWPPPPRPACHARAPARSAAPVRSWVDDRHVPPVVQRGVNVPWCRNPDGRPARALRDGATDPRAPAGSRAGSGSRSRQGQSRDDGEADARTRERTTHPGSP